jgi:hypothetical protein
MVSEFPLHDAIKALDEHRVKLLLHSTPSLIDINGRDSLVRNFSSSSSDFVLGGAHSSRKSVSLSESWNSLSLN